MGLSGRVLKRKYTAFRTTTRTTMSARSDSRELLSRSDRGHGRRDRFTKPAGTYEPGVTEDDDQRSDSRGTK
jgi:hypothetical protein